MLRLLELGLGLGLELGLRVAELDRQRLAFHDRPSRRLRVPLPMVVVMVAATVQVPRRVTRALRKRARETTMARMVATGGHIDLPLDRLLGRLVRGAGAGTTMMAATRTIRMVSRKQFYDGINL